MRLQHTVEKSLSVIGVFLSCNSSVYNVKEVVDHGVDFFILAESKGSESHDLKLDTTGSKAFHVFHHVMSLLLLTK